MTDDDRAALTGRSRSGDFRGPMRKAPLWCAALGAVLVGCPNNDQPAPEASAPKPASSAPAASAAAAHAAASATAAPGTTGVALTPEPAEQKPLCETIAQKSWGTGANRVTGLSTKRLIDQRIAVGLAIGNTPHVLVVSSSGEGHLLKVPAGEGSPLAEPIPAAEGSRTILRVTPYKVEGGAAKAYVDYKDEYKDKRKRIACGPSDGDGAWIAFEGVPLLDRDPKPAGEERDALFKKAEGADDGYHELRDCRTFIDIKKNETYVVGSELRAFDAGEGKTDYKASLVLVTAPKKHEAHLRDIALKGDPPADVQFEMPTTHGVKEGSYLLAGRFGGSLVAAFLNADKTPQSKFGTYPGYPTRPEASRDDEGMTMMVGAFSAGKDFELRGVRIGPKNELPKAMVTIDTGDADAKTATDPMFLRDGQNRRWLAYVAGQRGKGQLKLVGIDESFKVVGKPHPVTREAEGASEPRLVPLDDGRIFIVYIRESAGAPGELVSAILKCEDPR